MRTDLNGVIVSNYKKDNSIVFIDLSNYNSLLPIDDPALSITPPYVSNPIPISYNVNGNTTITAISLGMSKELVSLPCGLYKFKQSICPHDKLIHEFWYVHVDSIKRKIAKLYCDNKINEAKDLDSKLVALDALSMCMDCDSEKRINIILDSLETSCEDTGYIQPKNKILPLDTSFKCGCRNKCSCKTKPSYHVTNHDVCNTCTTPKPCSCNK